MNKTELIKELSNGYSTQSKTTNRFWGIVIISSIVVLSSAPNKDGLYELPLALGNVDPKMFHFVCLALICTVNIAYISAMTQAIRTRMLIQKLIKGLSADDKYIEGVHIQDYLDCIVVPTFNRVAPIPQYLMGKNQFFGEPKQSLLLRFLGSFFYIILKLLTYIFIYGIPLYSIYKCWVFLNNNEVEIFIKYYWLLISFIIITFICSLIHLISDIIYLIRVLNRINKQES